MVIGKNKGRFPSTKNQEPRTKNLSLLPPRSHLLVAVSGGADSMALLHLLNDAAKRHHWRLTVAHLNHGIRGKASNEDAAFVAKVALRMRIPCVIGKARVPELAKRQGVSLEMAARNARYSFLVKTARKVKADRIVTGHHSDDQVETILLKLVRGTGRGGLSGMAACAVVGGIPLVRPLLTVSRNELESLLRVRKISWREDDSNRDTDFLRNRVRHELLPLLEKDYNPGIREALLRTGEVLGAEDEWMDELAREVMEQCSSARVAPRPPNHEGSLSREGRVPPRPGVLKRHCWSLDVEPLSNYPLAARRRVIRLWLAGLGVPLSSLDFKSVSRVDSLMVGSRGNKTIDLAEGWQVHRQYNRLSVRKLVQQRSPMKPVRVKVPGVTVVKELGLRVTVTLGPGIVKERGHGPGNFPARASLNTRVWARRPLWIRACRAGDRLAPYGMNGSRKIQDIVVDAKVPRLERERMPVLECADEVIWLPGYRIGREWAVEGDTGGNVQIVVERMP